MQINHTHDDMHKTVSFNLKQSNGNFNILHKRVAWLVMIGGIPSEWFYIFTINEESISLFTLDAI